MKRLMLAAALALAPLFGCVADAQTYQDSGGTVVPGFVPIQPGVGPLGTSSNPMKISGSFSASLTGFQPSSSGSVGTPIAAQTTVTTGSTQSLPTGTVVIASNVGASNIAYCQLGASASTNSQPISPNGGWFAFTIGAATQITCVTSTSTTTVNTLGGSGLPTGVGGGGSGGGGGGSNASVGSTGSAVPASATYAAMSVGGNLTGLTGTANGLKVDASAVTQPISAASLPLPSGAATAANQIAIQSPTGSAVPPNAEYSGVVSGGILTGLIQANASAVINISTATTTQLVAAVAGKKIYVMAWDVIAAGAGNITLEYGTQTTNPCDTSATPLTGPYSLAAQAGISKGNGLAPVFVIPAGDQLCALTSAAVQMSGSVSYTQF